MSKNPTNKQKTPTLRQKIPLNSNLKTVILIFSCLSCNIMQVLCSTLPFLYRKTLSDKGLIKMRNYCFCCICAVIPRCCFMLALIYQCYHTGNFIKWDWLWATLSAALYFLSEKKTKKVLKPLKYIPWMSRSMLSECLSH